MPFVRPDVRTFLDQLKAMAGPRLSEVGPEAARGMFKTLIALAESPRGDLAHIAELLIPTPAGHALPARLYAADGGRAPAPILVFFHGGGWVIGDLDTYDGLCAEVARRLN